MGWFSKAWNWAKKKAGQVAHGAKKVGSAVVQGAKKVGEVGGKVVDVAKKISPYTKDIPVLGKIVDTVAKGGEVVDLAKQIGEGHYRQALEKGLGMGANMLPGRAGQVVQEGRRLYEGGRGLGLF